MVLVLWMCLVVVGVAQVPTPSSPPRTVVVHRDGIPTQRALAAGVRALLPDASLVPGGEPIVSLTERDHAVVIVEATTPIPPAGRQVHVLWDTRAGGPLPTPSGSHHPRPHRALDLSVPAITLSRVFRVLLPHCRSIGVVTSRAGTITSLQGAAPVIVALPADEDPATLVQIFRPQVDAVLLLDDPDLLARGEAIVRAFQDAGIPALTTAPWLARSGAVIGVVPDLDAAARWIRSALIAREGAAPLVQVPMLVTVDLAAYRGLGLPLDPARLAVADRFIGGAEAQR